MSATALAQLVSGLRQENEGLKQRIIELEAELKCKKEENEKIKFRAKNIDWTNSKLLSENEKLEEEKVTLKEQLNEALQKIGDLKEETGY